MRTLEMLREDVYPDDLDRVRAIVESSGVFSPEEVDMAVELARDRLDRGSASPYRFLFAERAGATAGFACYGPIPATQGCFDLYWIAIDANTSGRGIGSMLLEAVESRVAGAGGRRIYIETSSRAIYAPAHAFYERHGYRSQAALADFYAPGDDKIILAKDLPAR